MTDSDLSEGEASKIYEKHYGETLPFNLNRKFRQGETNGTTQAQARQFEVDQGRADQSRVCALHDEEDSEFAHMGAMEKFDTHAGIKNSPPYELQRRRALFQHKRWLYESITPWKRRMHCAILAHLEDLDVPVELGRLPRYKEIRDYMQYVEERAVA